MSFERIVLFGDSWGIPMLLEHIPRKNIVGIVLASNRPDYHNSLRNLAQEHQLPVLIQPLGKDTLYSDFYKQFRQLGSDCLVCNSYSMKIREDILNCVGHNAFNIHGALLPRNRGANPVQWAIIHGEAVTGVTLHKMVNEIDAGDIVFQKQIPIQEQDTWVTLSERLQQLTKQIMQENLPYLLSGDYKLIPQDFGQSTTNFRLTPDFPRIDFEKMSDLEIYNLIRAQVSPLGGAYYVLDSGEKVIFPEFIPLEQIPSLRNQYSSKLKAKVSQREL